MPAISLLTGPGGREPLFFNDSEYAYVNFISGVGNVFGVWSTKTAWVTLAKPSSRTQLGVSCL